MDILLVEDVAEDAEFLAACLRRTKAAGLEIIHVESIAAATRLLGERGVDIVLLDLNLPDASGSECVERILQADAGVPIVVLSGQSDEDYAIDILNRGVQDYLVKWEGDGKVVLRAIRYAIERKRAEVELQRLARYDSLTGIPNREYLLDQLERATSRARRKGTKLGLLFLDLDRFKMVNDTLGHQNGDRLLKAVVDRLRDCTRSGDLLARLGGDEFAVLLEDVCGALDAEAVASKIVASFEQPFKIDDRELSISASVGLTLYPVDNSDPMALLNNADIAMYQAKERGRNNFKFFTHTMHEELIRYHQVEADLKDALASDQFYLDYQPQLSLPDRKLHAFEALLRWKHPSRGLVGPGEFISIAEEAGYVVPIGVWVLDRACAQVREWLDMGLDAPRIAVNIAPIHVHQPDFYRQVDRVLREHEIDPSLLELELTERSLMEDTDSVFNRLKRLKDAGVHISLDDFGTGYSCLNYLRKLPIDVLKIDRAFVADLGVSEGGQAICSVILSIARRLSLVTVGEGIETEEQLRFLTELGCDYGQGFLLGRPTAAAHWNSLLSEGCGPSDWQAPMKLQVND